MKLNNKTNQIFYEHVVIEPKSEHEFKKILNSREFSFFYFKLKNKRKKQHTQNMHD